MIDYFYGIKLLLEGFLSIGIYNLLMNIIISIFILLMLLLIIYTIIHIYYGVQNIFYKRVEKEL